MSFYGLAKRLSRDFRVTLVDFYGFGETPHPEFPLCLDDFVASVVDLIHSYKMTEVTLVAHSFGGRVALKLAQQYGYLINKLVLIDSAGLKPRRTLNFYLKIYRHKLLTCLNIPHKSGSSDYRALTEVKRKTFVNIVNEDLTPILKKITVPILILWGEEDKETPLYMAKKLNKRLPNSALVSFPNCGHYCYLDDEHKTFLIVKSFLTDDGGVQ